MGLIKGFFSLNPIFKLFFISSTISSLLPIYFAFNFVPEIIYSIIVSTVSLIMIIIYLTNYAAYPSKWKKGEIFLLILTFITVFHLPSHYVATASISLKKENKDDLLIKIDKFLLGWLIKDGQISLWIDNNNYIGPHTLLGKFLNNSFQICYFFYYLIPYITMHFINLLNCGREIIFRYLNNGLKSSTYKLNWNNTLFLFSIYLFTCSFTFIINTIIPARSPRIYLKEKFKHTLTLSGLGQFLNQKCKLEKSANSFPSGHIDEILSIGLSYLITKEYDIGIIVIIFTILIALATFILRYHYFCDVLMAIFIAFLSLFINYYFGYRKYLKIKPKIEIKKIEIISNSSIEYKSEIESNEEKAILKI